MVDLDPEGPNPRSFQSISISLHANTSLTAPQSSPTSLCSFPTWTPLVCTPVPCSHPRSFQIHADSCPSYRCSPVPILIAYMSLQPCGSSLYVVLRLSCISPVRLS